MDANTIHYVVTMQVRKDQVEAFKALAGELVKKSACEAGNLYYHLAVSKKDPCKLAFLEGWKDREAITFHNETEYFKRILPQLLELCEVPPVKETFIGE